MAQWTETTHEGQPARLYPDGAIRNAKGHFLARHPGATEGIRRKAITLVRRNGRDDKGLMPLSDGAALSMIKRENQIARKLEAQRAAELAMMQAAASSSPGNPKVPTEAWGLLAGNLTERALMDENTGHAVSAVGMIGRMTGYLGDDQGRAPAQAIQVNVTIEAGALEQVEVLEGQWIQQVGGEDTGTATDMGSSDKRSYRNPEPTEPGRALGGPARAAEPDDPQLDDPG